MADSASYPALPLPVLEREIARACNDLVGRRRLVPLKPVDAPWWLRLLLAPPPGAVACRFAFDLSGASAEVGCSRPLPEAWLAPPFRGIEIDSLPEDLQAMTQEAALAPLLELWIRAWGGSPSLVVPAAELSAEGMTLFGWEAGPYHQPAAIFGYIFISTDIVPALAERIRKLPPVPAALCDALSFTARHELGATMLTLAELRSLQPQDITLLDESFPLQGDRCFVVVEDTLRCTATIADNQVTVSQRLKSMPPSPSPSGSGEGAVPLDDLPVRISFSLGEAELTLGELKSLQEGFTFELNRPASQPVIIRAQGKVIGSGELLQIGDQIGVRLIQSELE